MYLLHHPVLVAAITLLGTMDTSSAGTGIKPTNTMTDNSVLQANAFIESVNHDSMKRSLRQKIKTLDDGDQSNEERGWFTNFLDSVKPSLNLLSISDKRLQKILSSGRAQNKAFQDLDNQKLNTQVVYSQLGVAQEKEYRGIRYKFFKAYGEWRKPRYGDQAR
ncbi:RxLR effector protein [Phytophthora megakarya]|uniref:RxLR effector protein n=1 Tax=Phytophthora megakarya TaxID=4795 RepID=A0A225X3C1_9STRA|nr:RxLR effector protein [Phytophthora megakarya]